MDIYIYIYKSQVMEKIGAERAEEEGEDRKKSRERRINTQQRKLYARRRGGTGARPPTSPWRYQGCIWRVRFVIELCVQHHIFLFSFRSLLPRLDSLPPHFSVKLVDRNPTRSDAFMLLIHPIRPWIGLRLTVARMDLSWLPFEEEEKKKKTERRNWANRQKGRAFSFSGARQKAGME